MYAALGPRTSASRLQRSSIFPSRIAFLDERADAFIGVARHHVLGHHLGGVAIGLGERQLELAIERSLADTNDMRRLRGDLVRELERAAVLLAMRNHLVDEAHRGGLPGGN